MRKRLIAGNSLTKKAEVQTPHPAQRIASMIEDIRHGECVDKGRYYNSSSLPEPVANLVDILKEHSQLEDRAETFQTVITALKETHLEGVFIDASITLVGRTLTVDQLVEAVLKKVPEAPIDQVKEIAARMVAAGESKETSQFFLDFYTAPNTVLGFLSQAFEQIEKPDRADVASKLRILAAAIENGQIG